MATIYLMYYWCKVKMVHSCRHLVEVCIIPHRDTSAAWKMAAINVLIHKEGIVPNLELCPLKPERTWANWKQSWNRAWWIFLTVGVSLWPCFCLLSEKGVHFKFMQNLSMFSFRWYLSFLQWLKQTIGFSLIETYRRNDNEKSVSF